MTDARRAPLVGVGEWLPVDLQIPRLRGISIGEDEARATRPSFLDELDRDPAESWRGFYAFVMRAFEATPPRMLRQFPVDERDDRVHDFLVHVVRKDFAKLRRYRDTGRPFVFWLYTVANNFLRDQLEAKPPEDSLDEGQEARLPASVPAGNPDSVPESLRRTIREAFSEMGLLCRALIQLDTLEELPPRKILELLPFLNMDNKQVSDKIRSCKDSLRRILQSRGVGQEVLRVHFQV